MKISILIPCHNEEKGIGKVLDGIPYAFLKNLGYEIEVIVIDNCSVDNTAKIALTKGVRVIYEGKKGKGSAIKTGFNAIGKDVNFVIMLDGDNSYSPSEIPRLIEPLASNFSDVIIGSRLGGKIKKGSFKFRNRVANWGYTFLVRQLYRANTTDVLSGYFGLKKEVIDSIKHYIQTDGFALEMEIIIRVVKLGYEVHSVPITYNIREGESKLEPLQDGIKILYTFARNIFWIPKRNKKDHSLNVVLSSKQ